MVVLSPAGGTRDGLGGRMDQGPSPMRRTFGTRRGE